MKKLKDKLLGKSNLAKTAIQKIALGIIAISSAITMTNQVLATEKTYYEGDYTPQWGKIEIQGAEEKNNINYVTSDEVIVEIYARDDKCTPEQISYYLSTTPIEDVGKITNWSTYSEGTTETLSFKEIAGENKTAKIYAVFKDYNGNISHKYSGVDYEQTIIYDMNTTDATTFATGINTKRIYGMPFVITSQIPKREGYTFLGWSTDNTVKTPSYEGEDVVPADVALGTNEETATLYAIWLSNNAVDVPNLGNVEMSNPDAELTYDPDSGELGGAVPPAANEPETPTEIPEKNLPEIIEFGYGTFESKTEYTPGEYETVEYETMYTRTKYPVSYQNVVWSQWMVTKDEEGNVISTEPGNITLADIEDQYSTYIVYDFETEEALEANGVKGDSVELWTIFSSSEDTLGNAVYLAAYLNKADGKTTRHIAMWNGTQYIEYDADAAISAVNTFTETYTVTETKSVQITAPSSSTTHVYIPVGNLNAEAGMTWAKWLESEYNTTGETEVTIKTSDYVDVSKDSAIIAGEEYGFVSSVSKFYIDSDTSKKVYVLSDAEITNSSQIGNANISEVLQAEGEITQVPVPTGFTYYLGTGETGLVVKDASGNEFVWIPVNLTAEEETTYPDRSLITDMYGTGTYTLAGSTGVTTSKYGKHNLVGSNSSYTMTTPGTNSDYREPDLVTNYDTDTTYLGLAGFSTATELANDLVTEFNNMITSVEKYGGFYVGRYELGYDSGVVCKPGVPALTASTSSGTNYYGSSTTCRWYGLYKSAKTFTQGGVTSNMIWGTQWDAMVNFIGDHTATAPKSRYLTGADEYADKSKNVYDTSTGTVCELTATANYISTRVGRGGSYSYANASSIRSISFAYSTSTDFGVRAQLYIKN